MLSADFSACAFCRGKSLTITRRTMRSRRLREVLIRRRGAPLAARWMLMWLDEIWMMSLSLAPLPFAVQTNSLKLQTSCLWAVCTITTTQAPPTKQQMHPNTTYSTSLQRWCWQICVTLKTPCCSWDSAETSPTWCSQRWRRTRRDDAFEHRPCPGARSHGAAPGPNSRVHRQTTPGGRSFWRGRVKAARSGGGGGSKAKRWRGWAWAALRFSFRLLTSNERRTLTRWRLRRRFSHWLENVTDKVDTIFLVG